LSLFSDCVANVKQQAKQSKGVISTGLFQAVQRTNNPKIKCKQPGL
jgi:hypothetical protein